MKVRQKPYLYTIFQLRNRLFAAWGLAFKPMVHKMLYYFTPAQARHVAQPTCAASHQFPAIKLLIFREFVQVSRTCCCCTVCMRQKTRCNPQTISVWQLHHELHVSPGCSDQGDLSVDPEFIHQVTRGHRMCSFGCLACWSGMQVTAGCDDLEHNLWT